MSVESGALIDVSAGSQGDAGSISIIAPVGGASLLGTFAGASQSGGVGGSFSLIQTASQAPQPFRLFIQSWETLQSQWTSGRARGIWQ